MKIAKHFIVALLLSSTVIWFGIKDSVSPMQRREINQSIFTIGDANYQQALNEGKSIVEFGKMFWGLYPGGLAFSTPDKAQSFIYTNKDELDKFSSGWAIYELSGDFVLDTEEVGELRYLNKSLIIVRSRLED